MVFKIFEGSAFSDPHRRSRNLVRLYSYAVSTHPDELAPDPPKKILNLPFIQYIDG